MEHQIVAFEREGGNQELGAGSVTQSASFLITVLERGIDRVHKLVGLQASLSPARVKIRSWMFGKNLSLGATLVHPMFHAIANGHDHIAEGFYARAVGHLAARRHKAKRTARPGVKCTQQAGERAALRGIDCRITIAGKHFPKIDQLGHVKMHDGIGVAVARLLMNNVDRVLIDVQG